MTADVPIEKGNRTTGSMHEEWNGDMELESDDGGHAAEEADESGRYDIQERRPARSGRTNGTGRFDPPTTYTTDEEDLSEDGLEDQASETAGSDDDVREGRMARRRSYWLSKGTGPHDRDGEDEVEFVS